jgi:hypothetical protein
MSYIILQHRHFLGKMGRWEISPKLNPPDGYPRQIDAQAKLDEIESRPYRRDRRKLESIRPNYWIVPWGHPRHLGGGPFSVW